MNWLIQQVVSSGNCVKYRGGGSNICVMTAVKGATTFKSVDSQAACEEHVGESQAHPIPSTQFQDVGYWM